MPVTQTMSAPPSTFNCLRIGNYHWSVGGTQVQYWMMLGDIVHFLCWVSTWRLRWPPVENVHLQSEQTCSPSHCTVLMCFWKFEGCANFAPPCGQVYGHLWVCLDWWCSSRSHGSEKTWVQWSHVYGFYPLWTLLWWRCKWPLCLNVLPQSPHSYGHSPVCVWRCSDVHYTHLIESSVINKLWPFYQASHPHPPYEGRQTCACRRVSNLHTSLT